MPRFYGFILTALTVLSSASAADVPQQPTMADVSYGPHARNVLDFLKLILPKEGGVKVDMEDDIVAACLMTQGNEVKRK